jgi:hypothetical protein
MRKWVLFISVLVAVLPTMLAAQDQDQPYVTVRSNPSGCTVVLSGDITVAGITPTTFSQRLTGHYEIKAHRHGYEAYNSTVVLAGDDATTIQIELSPKTRLKAGFRSLVIPGWGQRYSGESTRGTMLTIGTALAAVTAGILYLDFDDKRDAYDDILSRYQATREVTERRAMADRLYQTQQEAYDAEEAKNIAVGILAGIWIYNVIDAVVFFPDFAIDIYGTSVSLEPQISPDAINLLGVVEF